MESRGSSLGSSMEDRDLLRYSRHIVIPEIDIKGQEKLADSRVLVLGLGGLGSPIAMYLAAAGVGTIILVDYDQVELSNLQRQIVHNESSLLKNKAQSARATLEKLNSNIKLIAIEQEQDLPSLQELTRNVDVVFDGTDNFESRINVNRACWSNKIPLISGAAIQWEGQVSVFDPLKKDTPCYECLYPESSRGSSTETCSETGVVSPLLGIIGSCQAMEGIKYLCGIGAALVGYVSYFDAKKMEWQKLTIAKRANCPTCGES